MAEDILDIIVPRGMQSKMHRDELHRLGQEAEDEPLSSNVLLVEQTRQFVGMSTILQDPATEEVDFIFYFDRTATFLIERSVYSIP